MSRHRTRRHAMHTKNTGEVGCRASWAACVTNNAPPAHPARSLLSADGGRSASRASGRHQPRTTACYLYSRIPGLIIQLHVRFVPREQEEKAPAIVRHVDKCVLSVWQSRDESRSILGARRSVWT
jgi:hypothetical protein